MAENPYISVVIPAYNAEKTLRECLQSVLNQTYADYEIIVVDNNSTDDTKGIILEFQKKNGRVLYISEPTKGRGIARNTGIKKARGEIIVTTDADCVAPHNWLDELTGPIRHEGETASMGAEEDLIKNYWTSNIQKANFKFFEGGRKEKYISHIDTKNFAIKSAIIKKLMFDPSLGNFEDFDLYLRLKKIAKIRFVPLITVGHNHKSSFIDVVRINFDRGYWTAKIYRKYQHKECGKEPMFGSVSLLSFLKFPPWMVLQFIKRPLGKAYFTLVSEISWRAGIIYGKIK